MIIRIGLAVLILASTASVDANAAHYVLEIKNMAYGPVPEHLTVGDTIEWKNSDMFRHTVTARQGGFDFNLPPAGHAEVTLKKAGIIHVFCRYHPTMTVRLNVAKR